MLCDLSFHQSSTMAPIEKHPPLLLSLLLLCITTPTSCNGAISTSPISSQTHQIQRGFFANLDPSYSEFHPLLTDPTSVFSFGFLRVNTAQVDLAVLHLASSFPLWRATPARPAPWAASTSLSFNGTLLLSNPETGISWSTGTDAVGDQLVLSNSSNLQIQKLGQPIPILWQSFDFPSDTIVQGQNFTSKAALFSTDQQFSMKLGPNYLALYMEEEGESPMYWKRTALEVKAQIVDGKGPIYARIDPIGFLGLYQNEKAPLDVLSFDSFNRGIQDLRRLTLESDGNLRGYYWNGSIWMSDFRAISESCDLPTTCGPYGLCHMDGQRCGCLDDRTDGCFPAESGDLCGAEENGFSVLIRKGVDLANKELLGFTEAGSLEECEGLCEGNCSCWGAMYSNSSGRCYRMDYPIRLVIGVGDESKVGYFKVRMREEDGKDKTGKRRSAAVAFGVVGAVILAGVCGLAGYRILNRRRGGGSVDGGLVEGLAYKDLSTISSFRSIELSNSFSKGGG